MKILLDTGIFSHSEFMEDVIKETSVAWGDTVQVIPVHGLARKKPDKDLTYQGQKEALFTVGRFIREGRIEAYDYVEIQFETMRGKSQFTSCNALRDCKIHRCHPALERSKFRQTTNIIDTISKGGKKDRKAGVDIGEANQIAFFTFLLGLQTEHVDILIQHAEQIGLTEFEVESLRDIHWFQLLCQQSKSPENYPDVFHLWTAERNGLDAVLTLEKRLPNLVSRVRSEKKRAIEIRTEVLRPLNLMQQMGVEKPDPIPLEIDRFYHLHEVL